MTETISPHVVESPVAKETGEQLDFAEILRRARTPIVKEGSAEPWVENPAGFDPAQTGWESAAEAVLAKIKEMQSSGLVQLTPEGLTPKQALARSDESAKLTKANARAAALAEQLRLVAEGAAPSAPNEQSQWNVLGDEEKNAAMTGWFTNWRDLGEEPADWQKDLLKTYRFWGGGEAPRPQAADGQTAEEAAAGLETPSVAEAEAKKGLAKWLEKIDFGKLAKDGVRYLTPLLAGLTLGRLLPPEQALNLTQTAFAVGLLGFVGFGGCAIAERVVSGHPRVAGLARILAAGRATGAVFAETGMLMAAGSFAGGLWHEREIVRQAAAQMSQPAGATGGGERLEIHPRPVDASAGQFGGTQPPADVATANEATQQAAQQAEAAAQAAADQAAAAAAQAAEAARQAAELNAATSAGISGADLSGGTIWGNELQFAKQLGVHHLEPAANLLKNFAKVLAQPQAPTAIGSTDTAYVINRDVAGWAVGQMDQLYRMDPSSMNAWQKGLWEIGRGLREANWQDLQAVTEEFVKQAQP